MRKVNFIDLGCIIGKVIMQKHDCSIILDIIRPGSDGYEGPPIPAMNISISGQENLIALRDALNKSLNDFEEMKKLNPHPDRPF